MKLKDLIEVKVKIPSDIQKMGYTTAYLVVVERLPIYGHNMPNAQLKQSKKTILVKDKKDPAAYILELKKFGRIAWKGNTPISIVTKSAKYNITDFKKL